MDRKSEALELEKLRLAGAVEEINREYDQKLTAKSADFRRRGFGLSGPHAKAIAELQMERAKAIIQKRLELRRETLSTVPELDIDDEYDSLAHELERTAERISAAIP